MNLLSSVYKIISIPWLVVMESSLHLWLFFDKIMGKNLLHYDHTPIQYSLSYSTSGFTDHNSSDSHFSLTDS